VIISAFAAAFRAASAMRSTSAARRFGSSAAQMTTDGGLTFEQAEAALRMPKMLLGVPVWREDRRRGNPGAPLRPSRF
jgi:hypothetical protein